jgi:hypothetical protein
MQYKTFHRGDKHYIAASSSEREVSTMYIWSYTVPKKKRKAIKPASKSYSPLASALSIVFSVIVLLFMLLSIDYYYLRDASLALRV